MKQKLFSAAICAVATMNLCAGQPGLESLSPASQTITGQTTTTYTFVISDTDGPSDLMGLNAIFGDGYSVQFGYGYQCWLWYDRAANSISVNKDDNWTSAPIGSGGTALNGHACTVNTAAATVSTSGNNLSLSVPLTLGGDAGDTEPIYMRAANNAGVDTNYQQMGTWIAKPASPFVNISLAPSQVFLAVGGSKTIQVTVTDGPGFTGTVNLSLSGFPNGARVTGTFNPTSITGSGTSTLTLTADSVAPPHNASVEVAASTPDNSMGQSAPLKYAVDNGPPTLGLAPSTQISGSHANAGFSVRDESKTPDEIPGVNMLINSSLNGQHACWIWWDAQTGFIWLANDDATSWSGMFRDGPNALENSQCTVTGQGSTITRLDPTQTLVMFVAANITMKPGFSGTKMVFGRAANKSGYDSGYVQTGTWIVP